MISSFLKHPVYLRWYQVFWNILYISDDIKFSETSHISHDIKFSETSCISQMISSFLKHPVLSKFSVVYIKKVKILYQPFHSSFHLFAFQVRHHMTKWVTSVHNQTGQGWRVGATVTMFIVWQLGGWSKANTKLHINGWIKTFFIIIQYLLKDCLWQWLNSKWSQVLFIEFKIN